jgi:hypothetical protein
LYNKHQDRILSKKHYENPPKWKWARSEAFGGSSSNESTSNSYAKNQRSKYHEDASAKVKSKNQSLFDGIWDLEELKKKYFRLAKLNHPDRRGSDEAMNLLNRYYQQAFQRILARSEAFGNSSSSESFSNSYANNQRSEYRESAAEKLKSKNQSLFDGIWDLKELKKRYFRLAKLNHPDQGGSDEAMKLLNQYYQVAFQRIQTREDS